MALDLLTALRKLLLDLVWDVETNSELADGNVNC